MGGARVDIYGGGHNLARQLNQWRRRRAFALGAISVLALAGAVFVSRDHYAGYAPPPGGVAAAPGIGAQGAQTRVVSITSRQSVFALARSPRGWTLQDRGGYPVSQQRVSALEAAFRDLRLVRPITRDPAKHARLNVGDPGDGGDGVLVQLQDERGAFLVDLILGYREDKIYARKRGDAQVWTISGDLPPLRDATFWLELAPFGLQTDDLVRLDIAPSTGPAFTLQRLEPGADFAMGRPFSSLAIAQPEAVRALLRVIAKLQPLDVAPAPSLGGAPASRLLAHAQDGVDVVLDMHSKDGGEWLKAIARTAPDANAQALARAQAINAQTGAWAFRLRPEDAAALTPSLSALAGEEAVARRLSLVPAANSRPRPRPIIFNDAPPRSQAPAPADPAAPAPSPPTTSPGPP